MKKKLKRFFLPYDVWNISALEQWLEEKAAQGWMPVTFGNWFGEFESMEPKPIRFRLEPDRSESLEQREARESLFEAKGWRFVHAWREHLVYVCDDPSARELHTDSAVHAMVLDRQLRKTKRWSLINAVALLIAVVVWIRFFSGLKEPIKYLAHGLQPYLVGVFLLIPLEMASHCRILRGVLRLRREIAAGVPVSCKDSWKTGQRITLILWVIYMGIAALSILFPIYQMFASEGLGDSEEPLPIVSLREMDPSLAEQEFEREGGTRNVSMMAIGYYDIWERVDDEIWLSARCDRLRFAFLAKPLYEEWLAAESDPIAIEDERFEEAVFLEYENGAQAFLGYQGNVVLYQAVHVDEDLRNHIDEFAAVMTEFQP